MNLKPNDRIYVAGHRGMVGGAIVRRLQAGGYHINVGMDEHLTIHELAELVKPLTGFQGEVTINTEKPDGTPRKLLDLSRLKSVGWAPIIGLEHGLRTTYERFRNTEEKCLVG